MAADGGAATVTVAAKMSVAATVVEVDPKIHNNNKLMIDDSALSN